ncbi:MAG: hypothetical protein Q7U00_01995 [Sulfurimonas sp.]|nr:hypothetical protein [Sulfurimonas sp.]
MFETETLAIWGAITGSIGTIAGLINLWIRLKQYRLDVSKLECGSNFTYESPTISKHKLIIRSIGRRPLTLEKIQYFIMPKTWKHKLIKRWLHMQGAYTYNQNLENIKLTEGEKKEILISLPNGLEVTDIYKVQVWDQSGKTWHVKWASFGTLMQIATKEELFSSEEENDKRFVVVKGYRLGKKYFIETKFDTKVKRTGMINGRSFWFVDAKKYLEKLQNIQDTQIVKFLASETESIE